MSEQVLVHVQEKVFSHAEELFEEGDTNHDGNLSSAELQELLLKACSLLLMEAHNVTAVPAWRAKLLQLL